MSQHSSTPSFSSNTTQSSQHTSGSSDMSHASHSPAGQGSQAGAASGGGPAYPPIKIKVIGHEQIREYKTDSLHACYIIAVEASAARQHQWSVSRRYGKFLELHKELSLYLDGVELPPLPSSGWGRDLSKQYLDGMADALDQYLRALSKLPAVATSHAWCAFLVSTLPAVLPPPEPAREAQAARRLQEAELAAEQRSGLLVQLQRLDDKTRRQQQELNQLRPHMQELEELRARQRARQAEDEATGRTRLEERVKELEAESLLLQAEEKKHIQARQQVAQERDALSSELADCREQLAGLQQQLQRTSQQADSLTQQLSTAQQQNTQVQAALAEQSRRANEAEARRQQLQQELSQTQHTLHTEKESREQVAAELSAAKQALAAAQSQLAVAAALSGKEEETQRQARNQAEQRIAQLETQLRDSQQRQASLESAQAMQTERREEQERSLQAARQAAAQLEAAAGEQHKALQEQLSGLRLEHAGEVAKLAADLTHAQERLSRLQQETAKAREGRKRRTRTASASTAQQQTQQLQSSLGRSPTRPQQPHTGKHSTPATREEEEDEEEEEDDDDEGGEGRKGKLARALQTLRKERVEWRERENKMEQQFQKLRTEVAVLQAVRATAAEEGKKALQAASARNTAKEQQLKARVEELSSELSAARRECHQLRQDSQRASLDVLALRGELSRMQTSSESARTDLTSKETERKALAKANELLQTALENAQEKLAQATHKLEGHEELQESLAEELSELKSALRSKEQALQEALAQPEQLRGQVQTLRTESEAMQAALATTGARNHRAVTQLQQENRQLVEQLRVMDELVTHQTKQLARLQNKSELLRVEKQLKAVQQQLDQFKELSKASVDKQVALCGQLERTEAERDELRSSLQTLQQHSAAKERTLSLELSRVQQQLTEQAATPSEQAALSAARLEELRQANQQLHEVLAEKARKEQRLQSELQESKRRLAESTQGGLEQKLAAVTQQAFDKDMEQARAVKQLQNKLKKRKTEIQVLLKQIRLLEQQVEQQGGLDGRPPAGGSVVVGLGRTERSAGLGSAGSGRNAPSPTNSLISEELP